MNFDNPIFVIAGLTGIIYVLTGLFMWKRPAKKINNYYGYRTPLTMKNQESWDFAQQYSAKELIKIGIFTALIGCLALVLEANEVIAVFSGITIAILAIAILFIRVERVLKKKFLHENHK